MQIEAEELMLLDPAVSQSLNSVLLVSVTLMHPEHVGSSLQACSSARHKSVAVSSTSAAPAEHFAPARGKDVKTVVVVVARRNIPDGAKRRKRPVTVMVFYLS